MQQALTLASKLDMADQHPVVTGLRWILDPLNRSRPDGRRWSMRALSIAAGLAPGHVEGIVNGRQQANLTAETAQALARAANVRTIWLLTGQGPREPFEGDAGPIPFSPAPPPVSETRVVDDAVNDLLNEAFDHDNHEPSDILLVGEALRLQAALLKAHVEPLDVVRALLDTAADARRKGKRLKVDELPIVALGTTKRKLASAEERIAQFLAQGDREAELLGVETRDTPHPLLVQQVDRMMGKDKKGTKGGKGGGKGARGQ